MNDTILAAMNIHAGYNKRPVLNDVSLDIPQHCIVSLVGPNGAGKSTVLKVIIGMLTPNMGKVVFSDTDITHYSTNMRINAGIGYFIQGGRIFKDLTCQDNLFMGGHRLKHRVKNAKADEIFQFFPELKERRHKRAGLLSGGKKQMLALGIILMHQPRVLLLDEPSAGLAPKTLTGVFKRIKQLKEDMELSILLVEQHVQEAVSISDRVYIMRGGKIIKGTDDITELRGGEKIRTLFMKEKD